MLLVLDDDHKSHLQFLVDVSPEVLTEFCRISIQFLQKGSNAKVYQTAAQKLGVDPEAVKNGVQGLMYLLSESSKLMLNEVDFADSIMTLGFSEDLRNQLTTLYLENQQEIRKTLTEMSMELPQYHNLEWRFDIQVASRNLRHQITPLITLKLHIKDGDKIETKVLQTDPTNLVHLTRTLEEALNEMKTSHCRRIVRNI